MTLDEPSAAMADDPVDPATHRRLAVVANNSVWELLGQGDLALHHSDRSARVVADAGLRDFDLGDAHEARARALACLGRLEEAAREFESARAVEVADPDDRRVFEGDLAAEPWFGLVRNG